MPEFKSGFVGLIGRPNVGKSTLLNQLAKQKVAIISEKPQTTRHQIRAVINRPNIQIVFLDTPGLHKPKDPLGKHLNKIVRDTFKEVDAILFMVDASSGVGSGDAFIARELKRVKTPILLVLNKIDLLSSREIGDQIERGAALGDFSKIVPVSALKGENLEILVEEICTFLPVGPQYYPEDVLTDQPEKLIMAEFIREKVIALTQEEVPYSVAVEVEEVKSREDKELVEIFAWIYVERESQKGILIGRGGQKLKEIGQQAREDIEKLLGSKVFLDLRVKVKKKWRRSAHIIRQLGY